MFALVYNADRMQIVLSRIILDFVTAEQSMKEMRKISLLDVGHSQSIAPLLMNVLEIATKMFAGVSYYLLRSFNTSMRFLLTIKLLLQHLAHPMMNVTYQISVQMGNV